ncbi:hypothetical protein UFOVP78_16 [uncultured Caudovirales phage]|uniref:Terminase-like family n=1 Tax=uncultured Caudovirales phage TaxID=2100421 RepID=A0A6J5KZL7_9CAUD|nr:hypothetical protein UFOVP78_16 [uncultured Caudovirales phage]
MQIDLGYRPRPWQEAAHRGKRRWSVLVWHRGAGKTAWALPELVHEALSLEPVPSDPRRFAYIAPLRVQAQDVVWDRLLALVAPLPGVVVHKAELRVTLPNGAIVQLYGADNPDRLRGITLDGVVLDEVAQMPPSLFTEVLLPALNRDGRPGWCVWIGTPKGRNAFWQVYDSTKRRAEGGATDAFADFQPVSKTQGIAADQLADARSQMTAEEYEQEFECSFQAAIVGAYYGREMAQAEADQRITRVPYTPGVPCVTAWDIGHSDSTVVWVVQRVGLEVRVLDCIANSHARIDWYAGELAKRPYTLTDTILPHDAGNDSVQTSKSVATLLREAGMPRIRVLPREDIEPGIAAVRRLLPSCVFDADRCARGLEALRQYKRQWDDRNQVFRPAPLHDWTSDYADAFRYLAVGLRPGEAVRRPQMPRIAPAWDPYSGVAA